MASLIVIAVGFLFPLYPWRRAGRLVWRAYEAMNDRRDARPRGRPIEQLARDARRLSRSFRTHPRGTSFVKYEAHRRAYDDVLSESCQALGLTHLLGVLAPGPELDAERRRVEGALELWGLDLGLPL
jgi:hypothetical protein